MIGWQGILVVLCVLVAVSALGWAWRSERLRSRMERRAAVVAAREAAFVAILQRLATAHLLEEILQEVINAIERIIPDCRGSILLIDHGVIRHGAAPSLPDFYNAAVNGMPVGEGVGSCGSAASGPSALNA